MASERRPPCEACPPGCEHEYEAWMDEWDGLDPCEGCGKPCAFTGDDTMCVQCDRRAAEREQGHG